MVIWSGVVRADGSALPWLRSQHVGRQHYFVLSIGGHASRSHTLRSMPLLVLPRAAATRGEVPLTDQGGIALFMSVFAHNFVFDCTRRDAEHDPLVRRKMCGRPVMLSSSFSLRLAFLLCLPPPLLRFSSLFFRLAQTFGLGLL
jgi:hypothetical protein